MDGFFARYFCAISLFFLFNSVVHGDDCVLSEVDTVYLGQLLDSQVKFDGRFLRQLARKKQKAVATYLRERLTQLTTVNQRVLAELAQASGIAKELVDEILIAGIEKVSFDLVDGLCAVEYCSEKFKQEITLKLIDLTASGTRSAIHLKSLQAAVLAKVYAGIKQEEAVFQAAWRQERVWQDAGYISFFHGQMRTYAFQEDLTTALLTALADRGLIDPLSEDFLFIQNPAQLFVCNQEESNLFLKEAQKKQEFIMLGRDSGEWRRLPERFSANLFLFGCQGVNGSCTQRYFLSNKNVNRGLNVNLALNFCEPFGLQWGAYEADLNRLHTEYCELFSRGRLLQIGIPEAKVDEWVYIGCPGAHKTSFWTGNDAVDRVSELLAHVREYPTGNNLSTNLDVIEVVIPLTYVSGLSPYTGFKVIAHDPAPLDAERYRLHCADRAVLVGRMADDIARQWGNTRRYLVGS